MKKAQKQALKTFTTQISFVNWLRDKLGTDRWVVARRSTKLAEKYDLFLSAKRFIALRAEFASLQR